MASKCLLIVLAFGLSCADNLPSNLPILYRVDQPNSNVVVFRGANVAAARDAGLLGGFGGNSGHGGNGNHGNGNGNGNRYNQPPTTTYRPPTTTTAYTTTTTAKPTYKPQPTYQPYRPAPTYKPAPYPAYTSQYADVDAKYDWEYAVKDTHYNDFGHKESRQGYSATGKYYVALPDGRFQTVTYVADAQGYRPTVEYSGEPVYPSEQH